MNTFIAKAPTGHTKERILQTLRKDPYQSRFSISPIILTHPRTGRTSVLKEFIEEVDQGSRFAIETSNGLIFVSRVYNEVLGYIFLAVGEGHWKEETKEGEGKIEL